MINYTFCEGIILVHDWHLTRVCSWKLSIWHMPDTITLNKTRNQLYYIHSGIWSVGCRRNIKRELKYRRKYIENQWKCFFTRNWHMTRFVVCNLGQAWKMRYWQNYVHKFLVTFWWPWNRGLNLDDKMNKTRKKQKQ